MSAISVRSSNVCSRHVPMRGAARVQGTDGCVILFWISVGLFWSDPAQTTFPAQLSPTEQTSGIKTWICTPLSTEGIRYCKMSWDRFCTF